MTLTILVDRMFSAEAAITIKQNKKKQRGVHLYNQMVTLHCLIIAQRQQIIDD